MIELNAETIDLYRRMPWRFLDELTLEMDGNPVRFGDAMDPWQRQDFASVIPGLMRAVGLTPAGAGTPAMRTWLERPRGHSKTSDIAALVTWELTFAPRPVTGTAAAADQDQARALGKAVSRIVQLNPTLQSIIEVQRNKVIVTAVEHPAEGSALEIIASGAGSSFGALVDFAICDEVSHWGQDRALWDSIYSTAAKRSTCMLLAITNAGWTGTWQYRVREQIRQSAAWHFAALDGSQASWISAATLAEQREMLPPTTFRRLWRNEWVTATDTPLLTEDLILSCIDPACLWPGGVAPEFGRNESRRRELFIGVDVGRTNDRTVITTTERDRRGVHWVREMYVMRGERFAVQRAAIERRILSGIPHVRAVRVDRGGIGMQLTEELETEFPRLVEGVSLHESRQGAMAVAVKSAFERGLIRVPNDRDTIDDFGLIEETETGASGVPKIRTNRGPTGHADRFWSLALALSAEPVDWEIGRSRVGMPVAIVADGMTEFDRIRRHGPADARNPMASALGELRGATSVSALPRAVNW